MVYRTPTGTQLEYDEDNRKIVPDFDEQLPLDVCSGEYGCIIYDYHGAHYYAIYRDDWRDDPGMIAWMAEELKKAYESPREFLTENPCREDIVLFYDPEYPSDDVMHKGTNIATWGEGSLLPPLGEHDPMDPKDAPFSVEIENNYADEPPSIIQITADNQVVREWAIDRKKDKDWAAVGEEVAWQIRLTYERPWEISEWDEGFL